MRKMIKIFGICLITCLASLSAFGQSAVIMLKFEDAEKAFNQGDYKQTITLLDEVEKAAGVTSSTLYLRIITEDKLFNGGQDLYQNIVEYDRLDKLRALSARYLKALADQGIDDKYRTVYRISESLSDYPKNKAAWKEARAAYEKQQEAAKIAQEKARQDAAARKKALELSRLKSGNLRLELVKLHQIGQLTQRSGNDVATIYILRPEEGTRKMTQMLYLNDQLVEGKVKPGQYTLYHFTPGIVKIGKLYAKNKRKVSAGAALLMGGVVGLAATSGKTIAQNDRLFFLELEAGKTYYVTAVITKKKKIHYKSIGETLAKPLLAQLKPIKE